MDIEGAFFDTKDYTLTNKKIGKGEFGEVYIVKSNKDDAEYAAKIINPNGMFNGKDQMMFLRETVILHQINHVAIIKFYGINLHSFDDDFSLQPTIITEYLPHGSLKEILDKEKSSVADDNWTPTKKYISLLGISAALRYLHANKILHRDLKPQNILIDENYYPRVSDFGLSRCFSEVNLTGQIGSPLYMAPEIINDDKYGFPADVYSFAIIAYEIVSGKEPFYETGHSITSAKLISKITSGIRPDFGGGVTEKMKNLISKCWHQDPKERPTFKEIFDLLSSDFTYLDEDVDRDEINEYLDLLKESKEPDQEPDKKAKEEEENKTELNHFCARISDLLFDESSMKFKDNYAVFKDKPETKFYSKRFHATFRSTADKKSFFREIELLSSLSNDAVLPLVGFTYPEENGSFKIFSKFKKNGSLEKLLSKSKRDNHWETIKAINIFGIIAGLAYLHQHGFIMQNMPPYKVLLDENFHPKISVCNSSKLFTDDNDPAFDDGDGYFKNKKKFPYLAPELLEGIAPLKESDVFTYSIILYQLLTDKKTAYDKVDAALLYKVGKGERPDINGKKIPQIYIDLLTRCWDQSPDLRPSSIMIVKAFIENKNEFFDMKSIDKEEFEKYIKVVTKDLNFGEV